MNVKPHALLLGLYTGPATTEVNKEVSQQTEIPSVTGPSSTTPG